MENKPIDNSIDANPGLGYRRGIQQNYEFERVWKQSFFHIPFADQRCNKIPFRSRKTRELKNLATHLKRISDLTGSHFIYESVINGYKSAIVAFDVKSENYEIGKMHCHELIEVNGKLAAIDYDYESRQSGYLDMWILEQTPRNQWERHIIRFPLIWIDKKPIVISSCTPNNGEITSILTQTSIFYNVEQNKDGKDSASFLQIEIFNELYDAYPYLGLDCINCSNSTSILENHAGYRVDSNMYIAESPSS
uniref:F-box associated beta-propeller type 3 domain-containing protein n=1 Tax=Solanum lycopersicum TaxID=4081 RepID=A0A3Q7EAB2_SOLLC